MNGIGQFVYVIPANQYESMAELVLENSSLRPLPQVSNQNITGMEKQAHHNSGNVQMIEHTAANATPTISIPKRSLDFLELAMTTVGTVGFTIGIESLFNGTVFNFWRIMTIALSLGLGAMLVVSAVILQWYESRA